MKTKTIKQQVWLDASPEEVYSAFLDGNKHGEMTGGGKATCDPKMGGKFTAWDGYIFGRNLKLEKGKRIVQEWQTTEWPSGAAPSIVEFAFSLIKGGTLLKMVHSKAPAEQAAEYAQGWKDFYWDPMKKYFKRG